MTPPEMPRELPPLPDAPKGMHWEYRGQGYESPLGLFAYMSSKGKWLFDCKALGDEWMTYAEAVPDQARTESLEGLLRRARPVLWEADCCDLCEEIDQALGESGVGPEAR